MPEFDGSYSRRPDTDADESLGYLGIQQEASAPGAPRNWIDKDWNDFVMQSLRNLQRVVQRGFGDGSPDDGFKVVQAGATANNFTLKGFNTSPEEAARMWVGGLPALLLGDVDYTDTLGDRTHAKSTGLTATVLTDTSSRWVADELVGRKLVPDAATPANSYAITANTATTITVAGGSDMVGDGAAVGDRYYATLTTPAANRTDTVYLDVYVDEVDEVEDTNLDHGPAYGASTSRIGAVRLKLVQRVLVNEGGKGHHVPAIPVGADATLFRRYNDSNGEPHWIVPLATLARVAATADILTAQITDARETNWGMKSVRDGLVGPDHTAVSLLRRFDEVRTWITVGDGVTTFGDYNGVAGLVAAISAAAAGSHIHIKAGTYTLTDVVVINKALHIVGETTRTDSVVKIVKSQAGRYVFDWTSGGGSIKNVEIDSIDDVNLAGIRLASPNVLVEDVRFTNIGRHGIEVLTVADTRIRGCRFESDVSAGGIEIKGAATADTLVDDCVFLMAAGADTTDYGVVVGGGLSSSGIHIRNCFFRTGRGGVYVAAASSSQLLIEGCRFDEALTDNGIRVDEANPSPHVTGCVFEAGITEGCVYVRAVVGGGVVAGLRLTNNWFGGPGVANPWVDLRAVRNALVRGNVFSGSTASAMLYVDAVGVAPTDYGSVVADNIMDGGSTATKGIHIGSVMVETVVSGNRVYNVSGSGIDVDASRCVITGNLIQAAGVGVDIDGAAALVQGNTVRSCAGISIDVDGDDCIVGGNSVSSGTGVGIDVEVGADRTTIQGNTIRNCTGNGIDAEGASFLAVMGNIVSECGTVCVNLSNGGFATVIGNYLARKVIGGTEEIDAASAINTTLIGNRCESAGGVLGDITADADTFANDNIIEDNFGKVSGEVTRALGPAAFNPVKSVGGGLLLPGDAHAASLRWVTAAVNEGGQLVAELPEETLPHGANLVGIDLWLDVDNPNPGEVRLVETNRIDGDVTATVLYDFTVDGAKDPAAPHSKALDVTVDRAAKSYSIAVKLIQAAGVGGDGILDSFYRAAIRFKQTR